MIRFQCEESLANVQIEINFALCKIGWQREYEDRKCIFWRSRIGGAPWNILPITKGGVCHWPTLASLTRSPICTPPSFPFSSTFIHFHPSSPIFINFYPCSSIPSYHLQVHSLLFLLNFFLPFSPISTYWHDIDIGVGECVLLASSCFVPQVAYFNSFNVQPAGLQWHHFGDKLNALAMPCTTAASFYSNQFVRCENWSRNFQIKPLEL